jgi:hypothetical protein
MTSLVECPHCSTRVLPKTGRVCPACLKNVDTPPEPEPRRERGVEAVYDLAAEQMRNGVAPSQIEKILTKQGLKPETAATVVGDLEQIKSRAHRETGQRMMLAGAFWCVAGVVVTALTYSVAASAGGGSFLVAWGAIVYGGIQIVRGFVEFVKS